MDAIISGQAAIAIVLDGESASCLRLDQAWPPTAIRFDDISRLMQGVDDVVEHREVNRDFILQELELAWARDRSIHLATMILDLGEDAEVRSEAVEALEELFAFDTVEMWLLALFYSMPLPDAPRVLESARALAVELPVRVESFLQAIDIDQEKIRSSVEAWESLPEYLFDGFEHKATLKRALILQGAFYEFVASTNGGSSVLFKLLVEPSVVGLKNMRPVLQAWAKHFKATVAQQSFGYVASLEDYSNSPYNEGRNGPKRTGKTRDILENINQQKTAIKELINKGDDQKAKDFIRQLVEGQRKNSDPRHIAMTLCDLSQHAKSRGDFVFQRDLALWASEEAPLDSWTQAQLGDSYRQLGQYSFALEHYDKAGAFGDRAISLCGRAEIFKENGSLNECLAVYKSCLVDFPTNSSAKNGMASALAHFGRMDESLSLYDIILEEFPNDFVAACGKAEVLRSMARFEEAKPILRNVIENARRGSKLEGDVEVAEDTLARIIRDQGDLNGAENLFRELVIKRSNNLYAMLGLAHTLRLQEKYAESERTYRKMLISFSKNLRGLLGLASILRINSRHKEALSLYDRLLTDSPHLQPIVRIPKASLLCSMGKYTEAVRLLPPHKPVTARDWNAHQIRGTIYLRTGALDQATECFQHGLDHSPWEHQRNIFRASLSMVRLREQQFDRALELVKPTWQPSLWPVRDAINYHVFLGTGQVQQASDYFEHMSSFSRKPFLFLRPVLYTFGRSSQIASGLLSSKRLGIAECDLLLAVA